MPFNINKLKVCDSKLVFSDDYRRPWLLPNGSYYDLLDRKRTDHRFDPTTVSDENDKALEKLFKDFFLQIVADYKKSRPILTAAIQICRQNGIVDHPRVLLCFGIQNEIEGRHSSKLPETCKRLLFDSYQFFRIAHENDIYDDDDIKSHLEDITPKIDRLDNQQIQQLHKKRDLLYENYGGSVEKWKEIMKDGFILQIWNTCALEGNTLSFEETFDLFNPQIFRFNPNIRLADHNKKEIIEMSQAFYFVVTGLKEKNLTYDQLLMLNKIIYDRDNDEIRNDVLISKEEFKNQLKAFIQWLKVTMHPKSEIDGISLSVLAHYFLVHLHPFPDGNGRTSRLIGDYILMNYGFPPVNIPLNSKDEYRDVLGTADRGDLRPLIRFIAKCLDTTLNCLNEKQGGSAKKSSGSSYGGSSGIELPRKGSDGRYSPKSSLSIESLKEGERISSSTSAEQIKTYDSSSTFEPTFDWFELYKFALKDIF